MSTYRIRFLHAARTELALAVDSYDARVPGLGDDLVSEVDRVLRDITSFPEIGRLYLAETRRVLVRRFPFSVVYQVHGEEIVILAVAHQRRRPGYWRNRR